MMKIFRKIKQESTSEPDQIVIKCESESESDVEEERAGHNLLFSREKMRLGGQVINTGLN